MGTVGGLSSSTSSTLNLYGASTKGIGGLASGLDTESLIEGMTIGTRTKIQTLQQKNQKYQWQMDAYRSVSDMLVKFSNKYLDLTSASSPMKASFFNKSLVSLSGANSKYLSVTGASSTLDNLQILAIKQLAQDTSMVTTNNASSQGLSTGAIDFGKEVVTNNLNGGSLTVTLNNKDYSIGMTDGQVLEALKGEAGFTDGKADYSTVENAVKSFNAKLATIDVGNGEKLSDKMELVNEGGAFTLKAKGDADGNLKLKTGSPAQMKAMGFVGADGKVIDEGWIPASGYKGNKTVTDDDMVTKTSFAKYYAGKSLTINYNGTAKIINMPSEDKLKEWMGGAENLPDSDVAGKQGAVSQLKTYLQEQVNKAFGSGKIEVGENTGSGLTSLTFDVKDGSSVMKLTSADAGMLGKNGLFGVDAGTSNRVMVTSSLDKAGLAGLTADTLKNYADDTGKIQLEINGVKIEGLTVNSSVNEVMNAINNSDAGVKVSYLETADRFNITSTVKGASGKIEFNADAGNGKSNLASALFGSNTVTAGQDTIMTVKYEGNVEVDIVRDSKSFNLDGASFTLNNTFGYDKATDTLIAGTEPVTFSTSVDTEKIVKAVSEMVKDYNDLVDAVNGYMTQKPDGNYAPLTDEQKADMTATEIEKWETNAKKGILYNDSLLGSLSTKLRVVFSGSADMGVLKEMGLDMGTSYTSNGKITFDEEKFKAKLQEDSEKIKDLFTRDASGNDKGGITVRLKAITDEFAKTTGSKKGLLIEKAGSSYAATSLVQNSLKTLMDENTTQISKYKTKLQTEIERYTSQFTQLEKLVSQMNSQSSYLSSLSQ